MIIDKDLNGNISITELTPDQAMTIQSALLHTVNLNHNTPQDNFKRRVAMLIDKILNQR